MYGKKRVVINNRNQIIIAGDKSWIPIGVAIKYENPTRVFAKFLQPENKFDRRLLDENSISINLPKIADIKKVIRNLYKIPK
jgi:hypothetical protein